MTDTILLEGIFAEINSLIERSNGHPIELDSGTDYSFKRYQIYSKAEVESFECKWYIALPSGYKDFLINVGASQLFVNKYGLGFEFHRLDDIEAYSNEVFLQMRNPFPNLLLIVSLTGRGDEGGIDLTREGPNFSVFSHEEDPELWADEALEWTSFSESVIRLFESEAEDDLP